jgi:hypothetical protein
MKRSWFPVFLAVGTVGVLLALKVRNMVLWAIIRGSLVGHPPPVGANPLEAERLWMTAVVTGVVLASSLWVILSKKYGPESGKWAYGVVGIILGFWLR